MTHTRSLLAAMLCAVTCAAPAFAETGLGLRRVGPTVSYVTPEHIDGVAGFGVLADLGRLTDAIRLDATADYWGKTQGNAPFEVKYRDIAVGARAMVHIPVGDGGVDPALGVGPAMHFTRVEHSDTPGFGPLAGARESRSDFGFDFAGGVGFELSRSVSLMLQTVYRVVIVDASLGGGDVSNQYAFGVGILFRTDGE
jgi:Outer membrane protein beta-barrel domain